VYLTSLEAGLHILGTVPFDLITSYDYAVLPLFMLKAGVALKTGLASNLFALVNVWLDDCPGNSDREHWCLRHVAAVSASSIATAITIGWCHSEMKGELRQRPRYSQWGGRRTSVS
jgi:TRAP-type C4-dicarboxylate transport system permease large subunit